MNDHPTTCPWCYCRCRPTGRRSFERMTGGAFYATVSVEHQCPACGAPVDEKTRLVAIDTDDVEEIEAELQAIERAQQ